jgi:hypothetical protein
MTIKGENLGIVKIDIQRKPSNKIDQNEDAGQRLMEFIQLTHNNPFLTENDRIEGEIKRTYNKWGKGSRNCILTGYPCTSRCYEPCASDDSEDTQQGVWMDRF